ncbi:hypothetical protein CcaverHIS002_0500320 [Cutaneotrichosporon cavernicola]|nr:hypothetical protein CcaverHIS002_0500320 [Cutaneotrichosporon cavernicola]
MSPKRKSIDRSTSFDDDVEKKETNNTETITVLPNGEEVMKTSHYTPEEEEFLATFDEAKQKKMYRKIDVRLLPMLALLYLFAYIDRANIGNAKIEGLLEDLHLDGTKYNTAQSIFFVTYILFEIPANIILERYFRSRPSWWLGGLAVLWGLAMTLHGVVKNYGGLLAVRLALGIPEAGFFPGAVYLCSLWYPRHMLNSRIALFYTSSALAGAFSGLLAFGIAKLRGVGGIAAWRWIFLLEGAATIALGLMVPFILPDHASNSKFLTDEERKYMSIVSGAQDKSAHSGQHDSDDVSKWKVFKSVVTDWQLYLLGIVYWSNTVPNYAMKFAMPTIIKAMGYSSSQAQLLSVPPYIVGAITACVAGLFSDRFRKRMPFIMVAQFTVIVALIIIMPIRHDIKKYMAPAYLAICLVCAGVYPIGPGTNTWTANNTAGPAKRAMSVAFVISLCNVGGIIGGYIFLESEKPHFTTGYAGSLGFAFAGVLGAAVLEIAYKRINSKRDNMTKEEIDTKYTPQELSQLGDRSPYFRYML